MDIKRITFALLPIGYIAVLSIAAPDIESFMLWYFVLFGFTYMACAIMGSIRYYRLLSDIKTRHRKFDDSWLSKKKILAQLDFEKDQDLIARVKYHQQLMIPIILYFIIGSVAGFAYPILVSLIFLKG